MVTESVKDDDPSAVQYNIHAVRNTLYTDACFLKVIGKKFQPNVLSNFLVFKPGFHLHKHRHKRKHKSS